MSNCIKFAFTIKRTKRLAENPLSSWHPWRHICQNNRYFKLTANAVEKVMERRRYGRVGRVELGQVSTMRL